jgi:HD-like signal output (HDOD) protein
MEWVDWIGGDSWYESRDVVPMVPAVAREVLEFSTDPEVPAKKITGVVSKDPVLATRVLQLANSAHSASAVQITSIENAVVRMGTPRSKTPSCGWERTRSVTSSPRSASPRS